MLAEAPRACPRADVVAATDPAMLAAGEALFNSPALLGGQAAKAELSCAACHRNGRSNPDFQMPHLSGAPGSADVTNSFFGPARANAHFDPVPIPDLAMPGKVLRAPGDPALPRFIRALVVEEFSGTEPSSAVLEALSAYVRSVGPCPAGAEATEPRRLSDQLRLIGLAVVGAEAARDDPVLRRQLIAAARHQLGLIDERYAGHAALRRDLLAASRDLTRVGDDATDAPGWTAALRKWYSGFAAGLVPRLQRHERASRYDPAVLRRALAASAKASG